MPIGFDESQTMTRAEIIATLENALPAACEGLNVVAAYLFGSWARGESRDDSDVDIGFFLPRKDPAIGKYTPPDVVLEQRLSRNTSLPLEVHLLNQAPLAITGRVMEEGVLVYCGDEAARVRLEVAIRGQYLGFKPAIEELHRVRLKAFADKGLL